MKRSYQVPILLLPRDPVLMMGVLVEEAGVRTCARPGCTVRWVGGNGHRLYCSDRCREQAARGALADDEGSTAMAEQKERTTLGPARMKQYVTECRKAGLRSTVLVNASLGAPDADRTVRDGNEALLKAEIVGWRVYKREDGLPVLEQVRP